MSISNESIIAKDLVRLSERFDALVLLLEKYLPPGALDELKKLEGEEMEHEE